MTVWDMGKRNVFEAVASGGVGVLLFTMNSAHKTSDVFTCSMVGFVIDLGNTGCDDLRPRFCYEMFGGSFLIRIG